MHNQDYLELGKSEESHWWFVAKRKFISSYLPVRSGKNFRILDAGCGTGGTSVFLSRYGSVTGVEQHPLAIRMARQRGLRVLSGSVNSLPFRPASFQLVTCLDVLYHTGVIERKAIAEMYRVLKSGGRLIVTDCAQPWLFSPHDTEQSAKYRYTLDGLSRQIENAGFRIRKRSYIFASVFPLFIIQRMAARLFSGAPHISVPPQPINRLFIALLSVESHLLRAFSYPFGSSVFIVADKP